MAIDLQMTLKTVLDVVREFDQSGGEVYQMAISHKTTRGTASSSYSFRHCTIKKEMLMFCHEYCLNKLTKEGALSSFAELHCVFEEQYNLGVSSNALRRRLIKDFDYAFSRIPYDTVSVRIALQTCHFLLLYSDALQSQLRGELQVAYMYETWAWRYHSVSKGIAPIGTTRGGVKSGKGNRLIVVDAITDDCPLRCDDSEVIASHHGISTNELLLSDSDDSSDVQGFPTAL